MATKKLSQQRFKVWLDDPDFGPLQQIGTLHKVGHDGVRFAYTKAWLDSPLTTWTMSLLPMNCAPRHR